MSFLIASGHVSVEARVDKATRDITALIGAMGALGPATAVAGAGVAAAGAGVLAFGVAAGKQVVNMTKATQAQNKYKEAVAEHGKASKKATDAEAEYQRTLAKMPAATREATAAWSALGAEYTKWSDSLAGDTMPVFTKSFQLFQALLPETTGLVRGTSAELDRFLTLVAGEVASPGFDRMMDNFTEFAVGSLRFGLDGIRNLASALANFGAGGGFDDFINNAREAGPLLGETLTNLAKAVLNLTTAGGDLGITMLTAANALAKMVNAIPPEALGAILQLYAGLKLLSMGMAAVTAVAGSAAVASLTNFVRAARFGGVGPAIAGVAQRMTMMQKAAVGLGVLGVAALGISKLAEKARGAPPDVDRLTTSLKQLASTGKFTGELQKTFGDLDGLVAKVKQLDTETKKASNTAFGFRIPVLDDAADAIAGAINDMSKGDESLNALKDDFKSLDAAMAGMVSSGSGKAAAADFDTMRTALRGAGKSTEEINKLFPQYRESVAALKAEQQLAAQGMGLFGNQAQQTKAKLDEQKASADGLRAAIQALNDVNRASLGGMIGFEAAIDAAATAAKENAGSLRMVNGELDVNSPKAQAAATALADLGAKTDAATTAAREGGASWERVNGIYSRGRDQLVKYAQQMGLSKTEAGQLADSILKIPDKHSTQVEMKREDALAGLDSVIAKIKATPGAKSVTVKTLSSSAIAALEAVGLKVKRLPDGSVTVTSRNGQALSAIGAVQAARDRLSNKSITITTFYTYKGKNIAGVSAGRMATGGRVKGYAGGGNIQGFPEGGYIEGPGSGTSDSILALMGSGTAAMVSNTEYVMRSAAVARYGVGFMDAINAGRLKLPGFAKGGKVSEKQKQAIAAEKARQKEGKSALTSDVTFTTGGRLAGYKNTETIHDLGMPDSVGSLVSSINSYLGNIKKAFAGSTEARLVKQMTSSGKALLDNQKKLEGVNKALDKAKDTIEDLKGKFDSLKTSVSSSLVSFANVTKIGKYGTSVDTLIKQLRSDTGRTTEFSKQLEQLKGKGLNAQSISEIAQAGVTGGGMSTAQSLLNATPAQIAEINALEKQLKLSADKAGTVTADAMYGAGIRSAEGLVKGLTSQQDKIEAAMMKIAKSMEAAIKKALGIKSPAKRLEPIGDFSAQGVEVGWEKRLAKGRTLLSGSAAGLRMKPAVIGGGAGAGPVTSAAPVVNLTATFNTMTLPTPTERRAFARAMAKDMNDALLDYQEERRR
jgi:hypothetical protein